MSNNFKTYELAVQLYRQSRNLRLAAPLRQQFDRAASSVVLNLAEGRGRISKGDQLRFYHIAFGSLRECQAILDLAEPRAESLVELADKVAAHLYRLILHCRGG
jgi:four helix bundle protein